MPAAFKSRGDLGTRPFEFHHVGAGFDELLRIGDSRGGLLVAGERKVGENRGLRRAAADGANMMRDIGKCHLFLARVAEHIGPDAVADEDDVDLHRRLGLGRWKVIGGEHGNRPSLPLHVEKSGRFAHANRKLLVA